MVLLFASIAQKFMKKMNISCKYWIQVIQEQFFLFFANMPTIEAEK